VAARFRGATLEKVWSEGDAKLKDQFWHLPCALDRPVAEIRLASGARVLRYVHELPRESAT
jgi:hypothetical protein